MATLTHEQQALVGAVCFTCIAAHRASLTSMGGIHFHGQTARKHRFIGNIAVQFSKRPLGGMPVRPSLFRASFLATLAPGSLADVGQVFQANDAVGVAVHNASADDMVAILFQPSLSSADGNEPSCRGTSAFLLQPLSQPRIMVGFGSHLFASIEGSCVLGSSRDCQVALSHIYPDTSFCVEKLSSFAEGG